MPPHIHVHLTPSVVSLDSAAYLFPAPLVRKTAHDDITMCLGGAPGDAQPARVLGPKNRHPGKYLIFALNRMRRRVDQWVVAEVSHLTFPPNPEENAMTTLSKLAAGATVALAFCATTASARPAFTTSATHSGAATFRSHVTFQPSQPSECAGALPRRSTRPSRIT